MSLACPPWDVNTGQMLVGCTDATLGCDSGNPSDPRRAQNDAVLQTYQNGAVRSREYRGVGWKSVDQDLSLSGAPYKSRDTMSQYRRRTVYDTVGRVQTVYFGTESSDQLEGTLVLTWESPTELSWERKRRQGESDPSDERPQGDFRYDAYGRRRETRIAEPDPDATLRDFVRFTVRDGLGNAAFESDWCAVEQSDESPDCSGADLLDYDPFGRVGKVRRGGTDEVRYTYDGMTATRKTDYWNGSAEVESTTTLVSDGLGRLTRVIDDPPDTGTRTTTYFYDALDRLVRVEMCGGGTCPQARAFDYDSLGNLRRAEEPESGVRPTGRTTRAATC
jgi:YD repeat-containing protein